MLLQNVHVANEEACARAEPTTSEQAPNHTSTIRGVLSSLVPAAPPGQLAHNGGIALKA